MAFRLIKDVDRTNKPNLKLRVVRCITKAGFGNKDSGSTLEVIFHDKEGGRITGVVKQINMRLYENRFIEGRVYGVRSYYIENNRGRFRTTLAQFKLVFHAKTLLIEFPEEHFFPNYMLDFRDYATLVDINKVDETLLFDVIGKVNEIHNPQEREFNGRRVRLIEIILEDLRVVVKSILLYGILLLTKFLRSSPTGNLTAEIPVLILQMCRAKIYRDKVTLSQLKIDDVDAAKSLSKSSLTVARVELDDLSSGKTKFYPVDNLYSVDEKIKQEPFIDIPDDLAKLIDQTVLFKVNVKNYQINNEPSIFKAVKLYTDPDLVKNYN
ncbi:hypothetical protein CASFOL_037680 [Castilleja foliolosa]|uniref:Replication protein A 70 kDa DNA-binding subunit B/D first OB fold domain-containing protein n=1 Tax=Castilleja foliolosa TaxID=1961234 RepID=A0ABD3BM92_9LAMI